MLILFTCLVFFFFIFTYLEKKDYSSPAFLLSASFLMADFIFIWNIDNWDIQIYAKTIVYAATAMLSWWIGSVTVRLFSRRKNIVDYTETVTERTKSFGFEMFAFISLICTIVYLIHIFKVLGTNIQLINLFSTIYKNATTTNSGNFVMSQMREIPIAIAYVATFTLLLARDKKVKIRKAALYLSIVLFLIICIFSTDRNVLLRYIIYVICLWILFIKNREDISNRRRNKVIIKKVLIVLLISSLAFFGLGKIKHYNSNFERAIGIYAGSGLYNFNLTINDEHELGYGKNTLGTIISTINIIKGERSNEVVHGKFITYRSSNGYVYSSNIYSALKQYEMDFGYFGVILFPMILGIFFEYIYILTKRKIYGFSWLFYSMCVYPILYFVIAEQFFGRMHLGRVYEIFWVAFFYFLIYRVRIRAKFRGQVS